ncbi:hypothetical protein TNCV_4840601 [Trichonephila clavipes]|nr:hypothetical protein TNCV_4840601 [Trichonephila clavipes]
MMPVQTTSTIMILFYNVRGPISTPGFSPDENTSRVAVQTESRLTIAENPIQRSSVQDRCSRHYSRLSFLWFTVKMMQTTRLLGYRPPALSIWVIVIREMGVPVALYRLRESCIAVTDVSLLGRSLN